MLPQFCNISIYETLYIFCGYLIHQSKRFNIKYYNLICEVKEKWAGASRLPVFQLFPIFNFSILHSIFLINEFSTPKKYTMFHEFKYYKIEATSHLVFRLTELFKIHYMQNNWSLGLAKRSYLWFSLIHRHLFASFFHFQSMINVDFAKLTNKNCFCYKKYALFFSFLHEFLLIWKWRIFYDKYFAKFWQLLTLTFLLLLICS